MTVEQTPDAKKGAPNSGFGKETPEQSKAAPRRVFVRSAATPTLWVAANATNIGLLRLQMASTISGSSSP